MNMSLTIKARLGLTMAFLGLLLVAIGGLGLYGMNESTSAYRDTFENQMPSANRSSPAAIASFQSPNASIGSARPGPRFPYAK